MARPKTEAATFKTLMLRLPQDLLDACRKTAEEDHRSMNAQILHMVEKCLHERSRARHELRPTNRGP